MRMHRRRSWWDLISMFPAYSHHLAPRVCSSATWLKIYLLRPSNARVPEPPAEPVMCMSAIHSSFIARRGRISVPDRAWSPNPRSRITSRLCYATAPLCARSNERSSAVSGSRVYQSTPACRSGSGRLDDARRIGLDPWCPRAGARVRDRRRFITHLATICLALVLLAAPLAVDAQPAKVPRIPWLPWAFALTPQNPSGFATDLKQFSEPIRVPRRPGRCASPRATAGAPPRARRGSCGRIRARSRDRPAGAPAPRSAR